MKNIFLLPIVCLFLSCQDKAIQKGNELPFPPVWYKGKAEVSSYVLQQARYGEIRQGTAVLIYVTEDFSASKLVKLDNPEALAHDAVKVLKLNFTREFNTGIYPYHVMSSVFTPVDIQSLPSALKVSCSVQEWCGHAFTQLRRYGKQYKLTQLSYFETENEMYHMVKTRLLEDELWTLLRINPNNIPTGWTNMLPGMHYLRFTHLPVKPQRAFISLKKNNGMHTLRVVYPEIKRVLEIYAGDAASNFSIEGWKEAYPDGKNGQVLQSSGTKLHSLWTPYWEKQSLNDTLLRKELGLPYYFK